jgi:hypothetical protein
MRDQTTKLCDFTNGPNAQFIDSPIISLEIKADSFEVSPELLNLIAKDQFGGSASKDASGGSASKDASMHLHDFCEICDMQKFKNVENDIVKLKLFPFSLRGKAKDWLLSSPRSMLDSAMGGAFMTKIVNGAQAILENMLQNFSQWHTKRAPSSSRNSVEELDSLTAKVDVIYSYISKQNVIMSHYKILLR